MPGSSDTRRPATPDSVLASSLQATSPIDDLTLALTNFSRVPSPELQNLCCCCGEEDCETTKNWLALKGKLESRLILSAGRSKAARLFQHCKMFPHRGRLCFVAETRGLRAAT